MKFVNIENKASKVKLDKSISGSSVQEVIDELSLLYGESAIGNYAAGEMIACAENTVEELEVEIHSPGGSVLDGYRIYSAIKELRSRGVYVTAKINTLAASMASVIAMAADKITIASTGRMMIHEVSTSVQGDAATIRKAADLAEQLSVEIANIYAERTGKPSAEIREMMKKETWISAKDAVENKFADEIFDKKTNVMDFLKNLFSAKKEDLQAEMLQSDLQAAEAQYNELTQEFEARGAQLETAAAELNELKLKFENAQLRLTELENTVAEKDVKIGELEAEVETTKNSAAIKASEILASVGHEPLPVLANENEKGLLDRDAINKLPTPEARQAARLKNWKKLNK